SGFQSGFADLMTAALPPEAAGKPVEVWFTDEARCPFGQHRRCTEWAGSLLLSGCLRAWGCSDVPPVPGQQLIDPAGGMRGDAGEHVGQPGLRIDVVEF